MRVVDVDGVHLGVFDRAAAWRLVDDVPLDLVVVDSVADPPVVRMFDAGRAAYLTRRSQRERRSGSRPVKELRFRPRIDRHDLEVKVAALLRFLTAGHPVRVQVRLRGREKSRPELAVVLLDTITSRVAGVGTVAGRVYDPAAMSLLIVPRAG